MADLARGSGVPLPSVDGSRWSSRPGCGAAEDWPLTAGTAAAVGRVSETKQAPARNGLSAALQPVPWTRRRLTGNIGQKMTT